MRLPKEHLPTLAFAIAAAACGSPPPLASGAPGGVYDGGVAPPSQQDAGGASDAAPPPTGGGGGGGGGGGSEGGAPINTCPPSWTTTAACGGGSGGTTPDFGPNVLVFDPSMSMQTIQSKLDAIYGMMDADQFDNVGYAYFFKPGKYQLDVKVGFYTHVVGLGRSPDDVEITGAVRSKADWLGGNNATCNFWRTAENLAIVPSQSIDNGNEIWAVSQGTSLRRIHVKGNIHLDDGGWSSGGFIGDSKIDDTINSGSQQQFLTRNTDLHTWQGANWNMVFVGDGQAPQGSWPQPPYTVVASTPVVREKPFLYLDDGGKYLVMVPQLKKASSGSSWGGDPAGSPTPPGSPLSIDLFYIARPGTDTATTLNAALAQGKHLLFTPGDYQLDAPLQVTKANTILLGLGLPVLTPKSAGGVLMVADVDGVTVAGLLIEASSSGGDTLLQVGGAGSSADHSANPTELLDVNCRIGGNIAGNAKVCFTINSNDVIDENSWLWRADHGTGADWNGNKSNSGIVVNGNDVTAYGLFSEHHQQFQTLWNGNGGTVFFYQSEMPYDPPDQGSWMESGSINGYPSYKVADTVTSHHAEGIGVYSFFHNDVRSDNAIETPGGAGIDMHHMMTFTAGSGGINNIINGTGGSATAYSND